MRSNTSLVSCTVFHSKKNEFHKNAIEHDAHGLKNHRGGSNCVKIAFFLTTSKKFPIFHTPIPLTLVKHDLAYSMVIIYSYKMVYLSK